MLRVCMEAYLATEESEEEIIITGRISAQACEGDMVVSEREYSLRFTSTAPDDIDHAEQTIEVSSGSEIMLSCRGEFDEDFGEELDNETRFRFDIFLAIIQLYLELPAVREDDDLEIEHPVTLDIQTETCGDEEHRYLGRLWHGVVQ